MVLTVVQGMVEGLRQAGLWLRVWELQDVESSIIHQKREDVGRCHYAIPAMIDQQIVGATKK